MGVFSEKDGKMFMLQDVGKNKKIRQNVHMQTGVFSSKHITWTYTTNVDIINLENCSKHFDELSFYKFSRRQNCSNKSYFE